jgi:hypothetical protein
LDKNHHLALPDWGSSLDDDARRQAYEYRYQLLAESYSSADLTSAKTFAKMLLKIGPDNFALNGFAEDFSDAKSLIKTTTIFISKHGTYGSGPFFGLRYYGKLADAIKSELIEVISHEVHCSQDFSEEIDLEKIDAAVFLSSALLSVWEDRKPTSKCCAVVKQILNSFDYVNVGTVSTLGDYVIESLTSDNWCTPLDYVAPKEFAAQFNCQISKFDWSDEAHLTWLQNNLKTSDCGV